VKSASKKIPFRVRGIDSDNDGGFINYHMEKYCKEEKITFTRCRPYKKNDQPRQRRGKNWSVVRQFIGYRRFETDEQLSLLQRIYPLVMAYHNFFSPMMRLAEKERLGSKVTKRYWAAMTPYQRLLMSNGHIDEATKDELREEYAATNPAEVLRQIRALLTQLENIPNAGPHTRDP